MFQVEISLADLIEAVQEASENDAQVLAALIHLLLGEEDGVAFAA